ncbi:MAG: hypothetical protein ASARMPRED_006307 [Alectoria sarmentosa]|nr:MAG: hypothetical protein ASARMPRED_006307 [Alectoria sarmentosa]
MEDIEEDEELFSITLSDVLTVQNSSLQKVKSHLLERLDSWNSLVLVMRYEVSLGKESTWWNYLQILPNDFDTLIYWSSSEPGELGGSAVLKKIGKDDADESFKKSLFLVVQQQPDGGSSACAVLLNLAHRMATLIMAYGFGIGKEISSQEEDEEEEADGSSQSAYEMNTGIVPLADLFNADGDLNNVAHLIHHGDAMTMVAPKPISKGQQIFNDFGQLPRSDLLINILAELVFGLKVDLDDGMLAALRLCYRELQKKGCRSKLPGSSLQQRGKFCKMAMTLVVRPPESGSFEFDQLFLLTITALLLDTDTAKQATARIWTPNQPLPFLLTTMGLVLKEIIFPRQKAYTTTLAEHTALLGDLSFMDTALIHPTAHLATYLRRAFPKTSSKSTHDLASQLASISTTAGFGVASASRSIVLPDGLLVVKQSHPPSKF